MPVSVLAGQVDCTQQVGSALQVHSASGCCGVEPEITGGTQAGQGATDLYGGIETDRKEFRPLDLVAVFYFFEVILDDFVAYEGRNQSLILGHCWRGC